MRCPVCLTENEAHFKFCLACGGELVSESPADEAKGASNKGAKKKHKVKTALKTDHLDATLEPRGAAVKEAVDTPTPVKATSAKALEPVTVEAMHAAGPGLDGAAPAFEDDEDDDGIDIERTVLGHGPRTQRICISCGNVVPGEYNFCPGCGSKYELGASAGRTTTPPPQTDVTDPSQTLAMLIQIRPDGSLGETVPIMHRETTIGRNAPSAVFQEDAFLSPDHAQLEMNHDGVFVTDLGSVNGTYQKITDEVELVSGDRFRLGQELLLFESVGELPLLVQQPTDDTKIIGSPLAPSVWGRLSQIVALDYISNAFLLELNEVVLGRENGNIVFPEDGFVSGRHSKISHRDGRFYLRDLDSSNGTYFRIRGRTQLKSGDVLLLGQQLFQIDF